MNAVSQFIRDRLGSLGCRPADGDRGTDTGEVCIHRIHPGRGNINTQNIPGTKYHEA